MPRQKLLIKTYSRLSELHGCTRYSATHCKQRYQVPSSLSKARIPRPLPFTKTWLPISMGISGSAELLLSSQKSTQRTGMKQAPRGPGVPKFPYIHNTRDTSKQIYNNLPIARSTHLHHLLGSNWYETSCDKPINCVRKASVCTRWPRIDRRDMKGQGLPPLVWYSILSTSHPYSTFGFTICKIVGYDINEKSPKWASRIQWNSSYRGFCELWSFPSVKHLFILFRHVVFPQRWESKQCQIMRPHSLVIQLISHLDDS